MVLSPRQIYDKLVTEDHILTLEGRIRFHLGDVSIIVRQRDVVGNIMQEWLQGWMDQNGIEYAPSENTQMPPDFFLSPNDRTKNLLEVKAFNRSASPGFDIADFNAYQEEIINKPYMLDVDYLIFGYDMSNEGIVTIKDVWLKKVWEITRRMDKWPLNLQTKDNVVHKIRPAVWYSDEGKTDYATFGSLEEFISAMEETMFQNPKTHNKAGTWKNDFLENYKQFYGVSLIIPRWIEIKDTYDLKARRRAEKALADKEKADRQHEKYKSNLQIMLQRLAEAQATSNIRKIEKAEADVLKAEENLKKAEEKLQKALQKQQKT